jgi:hypothetical protein
VTFSKPFSSRLDFGFGLAVRKYGNANALSASDDEYMHVQTAYRILKSWKLTYRYVRDKSKLDLPFSTFVSGDTLLQYFPHFERRQTRHFLSVSGSLLRTEIGIQRGSYAYGVGGSPDGDAHQTDFLLQQAVDAWILPLAWGIQSKGENFSATGLRRETRQTAHVMLGTHLLFLSDFRADLQAYIHLSTNRRIYLLGSGQVSRQLMDALSGWIALFQGIRDPSLGERTAWFFSPFPPVTPNDWVATLQPFKPASNRSLFLGKRLRRVDGFLFKRRPDPNSYARLSDLERILECSGPSRCPCNGTYSVSVSDGCQTVSDHHEESCYLFFT